MQFRAVEDINLGKIQSKIISLKKNGLVELEDTPEIKALVQAGILKETYSDGDVADDVDGPVDEIDKFKNIKGIGPELAEYLINAYRTYENFSNKITEEKLEKMPGIGKIRAKGMFEIINIKNS